MTAPRVGAWVFMYDVETASKCSTYCASACAALVRTDADFRTAVLGL
jgi:hypothetical protein